MSKWQQANDQDLLSLMGFSLVNRTITQSPSQSAPTILKNRAPCFLKNGAPCFLQKAGWKKQGHSLFKKRRDQAASSLFELQWPWFFALCFFQKAGCPIFKKQGARFLRIVGADKVIYTKYSKHWPYTVAHTLDCVCSKIDNSWFNPWFSFYFLSLYNTVKAVTTGQGKITQNR